MTYQNYDLSIYQSLKLFELRVSCSPWVDQGSCFWTFHCQRTKKKEGRFCNRITTTIGLKHRNRRLLKADQGSWSFHQICQRTKKKEGRFCKRDTTAIGKKKPKRKTEKAPQGRAEEAPAMPVAGEQVCGRSCQSAEVHYVTNELYQLNMRHKNVINENTGLKSQIEDLKRTIYWLENNVKSLQNELRKRPRIEEVKHLIEEL